MATVTMELKHYLVLKRLHEIHMMRYRRMAVGEEDGIFAVSSEAKNVIKEIEGRL